MSSISRSRLRNAYACLRDEKSIGTGGGSAISGWQTRTLNVSTGALNVTLSINVFTLQPGEYAISASAPAAQINLHKIRLRNVSADLTALRGGGEYAPVGAQSRSFLAGTITVISASNFRIEHYCEIDNGASNALGLPAFGDESEVYTIVEIWRLT